MSIKLYNSLTRQLEQFKPIKKGRAGMYTCGPTVYNYAHIGNLRTYVFEDILKRVLSYNHYKVKHIMNITDVGHLTSDADQLAHVCFLPSSKTFMAQANGIANGTTGTTHVCVP